MFHDWKINVIRNEERYLWLAALDWWSCLMIGKVIRNGVEIELLKMWWVIQYVMSYSKCDELLNSGITKNLKSIVLIDCGLKSMLSMWETNFFVSVLFKAISPTQTYLYADSFDDCFVLFILYTIMFCVIYVKVTVLVAFGYISSFMMSWTALFQKTVFETCLLNINLFALLNHNRS